jgi:undecaprenyl-diphosphatase
MLLCFLLTNFIPDIVMSDPFSLVAASSISLALFFSLLVRNGLFCIAMTAWSFICCWASVDAGSDSPSDVLVGLLWGIFVAVMAYLLYLKLYFFITPRLNYISTHYTSTGYSFIDIHVVLTVLTLIYAFLLLETVVTAI